MNIDRRCFIQGSALAVSSMAFAKKLPLAMIERGLAHPTEETTEIEQIVFTIAGWDLNIKQAASNEIVILINHSWRSAWR